VSRQYQLCCRYSLWHRKQIRQEPHPGEFLGNGGGGEGTRCLSNPATRFLDGSSGSLSSSHYPTKPLQSQGLFNSSITPKAPKMPSNTWHHLPPIPPILSRSPLPNKPQIFLPTAKPDSSTFHLYIYIYLLYAATKYFAHYPHHGCH
jgi:hypothetical protein